MLKSPEAFRTISEVAEQLDVPAHVLRFWETRFTQIKPVKRGGGRRYYRPDDVRLLRGIRGLLYDEGLTIKGVQKLLRENGIRHVIARGAAEEASVGTAIAAAPAALTNGAARPDAPFDLFSRPLPARDTPPGRNADASRDGHASEAEPADDALRPDRAALRQLVRQLEDLRAVMVEPPRA